MIPEEPEAPPGEEGFSLWLAAYDEQLAAGAPAELPDGAGVPASLRSRLEREVAWCRWVRRIWPRGDASLREPSTGATGEGTATRELIAGEGPATAAPPVERVGRFVVQQELGRGGFGVVYRAYDPRLRRAVALKVPRAEVLMTAGLRARFEREAMAAAGLDHPNIVPVFEAGADGSTCYIASAYCPGPTLAAWLKRRTRPVPHRAAAGLVATVAEAVEHAHRRGVLHRDLKPSNILLEAPAAEGDRDDDEPVPRVADFGLAKLLTAPSGEADAANATLSGVILGTASYMAPEQADGRPGAVGPAADTYSLGVIFYEVLTGRPPFQADSTLETLTLVRTQDPVPPSRLRPRLPRDLETICLKCLEKDPRRRYATAGELADDLRRFLAGEPIRARPTPAWERARKWVRRRPAVAALIAVSVLAALIVIAVTLVANARLQRQKEYADARRQDAEAQSREAKLQREQALANLRIAAQSVDQMLTRVGDERLANVPQAETVRRDLLRDALEFYEGFIRQRGDDPGLAFELARAHRRLAETYLLLGDRSRSEQGYRRAIAVLESPGLPFPDVLAHDRELARTYCDLSQSLDPARGRQEVEAALRHAQALQERLLASYPDDVPTLANLATTHNALGMLFGQAGRYAESERAFRAAIDLDEELVRRHPGEPGHRRDLAISRQNLAALFGTLRRFEEARELFRRIVDFWEGLVALHPEVPDYRSKLALAYRNLSHACRDTGRPAEAEQALRRAAELRRKLAEDFPNTPHNRAELGYYLSRLAECALRRGDAAEARPLVEESIKQLQQALSATPENPGWLGYLRDAHTTRAEVFLGLGQPDEAARLITALTELPSADARDWLRAGSVLARSAAMVEKDDAPAGDRRRQQARAYADRAIACLREAIRKGYRDRTSLETDENLAVLRPRGDFKELLDGIAERGQPK
jgi:tetratricopeptide (TPR) repeat protein